MLIPVSAEKFTSSVIPPSKRKVGGDFIHKDGRTVRIVGGQYWGTHGLSNFWDWREILADGTLSEKIECGYGWM